MPLARSGECMLAYLKSMCCQFGVLVVSRKVLLDERGESSNVKVVVVGRRCRDV